MDPIIYSLPVFGGVPGATETLMCDEHGRRCMVNGRGEHLDAGRAERAWDEYHREMDAWEDPFDGLESL